MSTLSGKTVLVIGGSSGIGFAVALGSLKANAKRVIIASSSQDGVANALGRLKTRYTTEAGSSAEGRVDSRVVDVTNHTAVKALFAELGEIDHLVLTHTGSFVQADFKEFDLSSPKVRSSMDQRYWSSLQAAQSAQIKPGGSIIFTVEDEGGALYKPIKKWTLTIGALGALEAATRSLAVELAPIRVNIAFCVASVVSSMTNVVALYQTAEPLYHMFDKVCLISHGCAAYYEFTPTMTQCFLRVHIFLHQDVESSAANDFELGVDSSLDPELAVVRDDSTSLSLSLVQCVCLGSPLSMQEVQAREAAAASSSTAQPESTSAAPSSNAVPPTTSGTVPPTSAVVRPLSSTVDGEDDEDTLLQQAIAMSQQRDGDVNMETGRDTMNEDEGEEAAIARAIEMSMQDHQQDDDDKDASKK
ncbi:NAD(P)-binding protein [Fistulina hepatica ATCC 64428]|uniref:NAD(P)-binding protein n=1 Tax=Fistulina hepatica ATCC 64428 TaxID=1128425 RepID=A0A0D7A091_9AGAR|nr:NAD(P)-binding protein [Fistulina hepatica ATCC 64428]